MRLTRTRLGECEQCSGAHACDQQAAPATAGVAPSAGNGNGDGADGLGKSCDDAPVSADAGFDPCLRIFRVRGSIANMAGAKARLVSYLPCAKRVPAREHRHELSECG